MSEKEQTVLITGALAGIGRATAIAFAQHGANVVVSGRRPDAGEALAAELRDHGAVAEFVAADVRHESEVRELVDATVQRFGRLDAAVNNAGIEGEMVPFAGVTPESYAATFDTNVLGTLGVERKPHLAIDRAEVHDRSGALGLHHPKLVFDPQRLVIFEELPAQALTCRRVVPLTTYRRNAARTAAAVEL